MSKFDLSKDLFKHQREDLDRLLKDESGYLNLSEMGTGKTPTAIGLAIEGGYQKTLIVCPKTLRLEWRRQIMEWSEVDPAVSKRGCYRRLEPLFYDMMKGHSYNPYFIVNYDTFRTWRHLDVLNTYPFDLVIFDEAHRLRRPRTGQTKGVKIFLENHPNTRVMAMTGSPIVNVPCDLHTLLCMVKPDTYKWEDRDYFENRYSVLHRTPVMRCRDCGYYKPFPTRTYHCPRCDSTRVRYFKTKKVAGTQNLAELKRLTEPFTIRRTKEEVLPWLPEKYYRRVLLEMDSAQRKLYDQMEKELFIMLDSGEPLWAPGVLSLLTRLRQLNLEPKILGVDAPSAKTEFLKGLVSDLGDRKLVVYSTSEKYIMYLHYVQNLPEHVIITGDVPVDDRMEAVRRFQEDPSVKLCLGTMQCMGEGLTLTAASDVVLMDKWWTPTMHTQSEDRLHRIGQKSAVQVIIPTVEKSIDQSMDTILEKKRAMAEEYLGEQDSIKEVIDDLRRSRLDREPDEDEDDTDEVEEVNGNGDEFSGDEVTGD